MMTARDYSTMSFEDLAKVADRLWIAINNPRTRNLDQVRSWYQTVTDRMVAIVLTGAAS